MIFVQEQGNAFGAQMTVTMVSGKMTRLLVMVIFLQQGTLFTPKEHSPGLLAANMLVDGRMVDKMEKAYSNGKLALVQANLGQEAR